MTVTSPTTPVPTRLRLSAVRGLITTARPRQWIKNLLVVAAAGAAGALGRDDVPVRTLFTFLAFCLMASGTYAINDIRDVREDREHPIKRLRPIAAGRISSRVALVAALLEIASGLGICWTLTPLLAVVAAAYIAITLTYTLIWRQVVVLDIIAVASGFVLRAVAGGVAANVSLSKWFIMVVALAAGLLATGKRRAEFVRATADRSPRRRVLRLYTEPKLRAAMSISALAALAAYCLWACEVPAPANGIPWRLLTVIPFGLGAIRYLVLAGRGGGEAPEELLFSDRLMRLLAISWLTLFVLVVNATT